MKHSNSQGNQAWRLHRLSEKIQMVYGFAQPTARKSDVKAYQEPDQNTEGD